MRRRVIFEDATPKPQLCDAGIVQETCDLLTGEIGSSRMTAAQLQAILVSNEISTNDLWNAIHLELGTPATCQSMCIAIVDLLKAFGECPPSSDIGCTLDDSGYSRCDIDLSADAIKANAKFRDDLPDFHDAGILERNKADYPMMGRGVDAIDIGYSLEEMVQRSANLFRIYPRALEVGVFASSAVGSSAMETNASVFASAGCSSWCAGTADCHYESCKSCYTCSAPKPNVVEVDCPSYCTSPVFCTQYHLTCGKCSFCNAPAPPPMMKPAQAPTYVQPTYVYPSYGNSACQSHCYQTGACQQYPYSCQPCKHCQAVQVKPLPFVVQQPFPYVVQQPLPYVVQQPLPYVVQQPVAVTTTQVQTGSCDPVYCRNSRDCTLTILCGGCKFCAPTAYAPFATPGHVLGKPVAPAPAPPGIKSSWRDEVKQTNLEAQAYVNMAIRSFNKGSTSKLIIKWFGAEVESNPAMKQRVQKALNSVNNMLGNVEYVYPGPGCKPNTYAYVYPAGPQARDSQGRFLFFLCDLYMKSQKSVQIETLTHEGSHHAVAFLDDVDFESGRAYGRDTCVRLASQNPHKAVQNADSFCYYVQDITDDPV